MYQEQRVSRTLHISHRLTLAGPETKIEVPPPYFLFGPFSASTEFWSIPKLREVGIVNLTRLGYMDPIYFDGWDMMSLLEHEIALLQRHLPSIEYHSAPKAAWLSHLVYCHALLIDTAPPSSIPLLAIL